MRFLADMGISPKVVDLLRAHGHDALHLYDQGLGQLPDADVLDKARQEGRILLTHDLDFADLVALGQSGSPSVVIFRLRDMRPCNVYRHLQAIIARHADALTMGTVISVTEGRVRVRSLPIGDR